MEVAFAADLRECHRSPEPLEIPAWAQPRSVAFLIEDSKGVTIQRSGAYGMDDFVQIEGLVEGLELLDNVHVPRPRNLP